MSGLKSGNGGIGGFMGLRISVLEIFRGMELPILVVLELLLLVVLRVLLVVVVVGFFSNSSGKYSP